MQAKTKTERIKGFVASGLDNASIARRVGCSTDYVRAIRKRMREPDYCNAWARERYHSDPEYRAARLASDAKWRQRQRQQKAA